MTFSMVMEWQRYNTCVKQFLFLRFEIPFLEKKKIEKKKENSNRPFKDEDERKNDAIGQKVFKQREKKTWMRSSRFLDLEFHSINDIVVSFSSQAIRIRIQPIDPQVRTLGDLRIQRDLTQEFQTFIRAQSLSAPSSR